MKKTLLLIITAFSTILNAQSLPTPLISHNFDSGVTHSNFTVGTGITRATDRFGGGNKAAYFGTSSGEFSIDITNYQSLKTTGSIAFWYKHETTTNGNINTSHPLIYLDNGRSSFYEGLMFARNKDTFLARLVSYVAANSGLVTDVPNITFSTTVWDHFVLTYNYTGNSSGFIKLYKNGVLVANHVVNFNLPSTTRNKLCFLGHNALGNLYTKALTGYLDDINVYSNALSDAQVSTLYANSVVPSDSNDVKYTFTNSGEDVIGNNDMIPLGNVQYPIMGTNNNKVAAFNIGTTANVSASIPSVFNYRINDDTYSVAMAVRPIALTGDAGYNNYRTLLVIPKESTSAAYNLDERLSILISKNTGKFVVKYGQYEILSNTIIDANDFTKWYYLTVVVDGQSVKLYVNGNLEVTLSLAASQLLNVDLDRNILIANTFHFGFGDSYFRGYMDDIYITTDALTASQVSDLATNYNNVNTLGTSQFNSRSDLKIYPNPTTGIVNLVEQVNAQVFDIQGRMVLERKNVNQINLKDQNSGIYLLKLENDKGVSTHKIIKN